MATGDQQLEAFAECVRRLQLQWEATTTQWRDSVQGEFSSKHYLPLIEEHKHMASKATALVAALQLAQRSVH